MGPSTVASTVREQFDRFHPASNRELKGAENSAATLRNREVPRNTRSRTGAYSVPFPQRDRIKRKFIAGKNISQISREEGRHWETVARIVKEKDVEEYVRGVRERFYGALEEMLSAAIDYAKTGKDGGWLAYEMLKDGGVIPQGTIERHGVSEQHAAALPESEEAAVKRIAVALVEDAIQRHRFFGLPLPEADEVQQTILAKKQI